MEFEVSYDLESAEQFWDELDDIVSAHAGSHETIDNALRSYLRFTSNYKDEYLQSDYDVARCTYKLLESALFKAHMEYVRRQIVYGLLQEDESQTLHLITAILLYDGRNHDETFQMMQTEGAFPRLIELIRSHGINGSEVDRDLHRLLLDLLYEMSRMQRLTWEDLTSINDEFVLYLFQIIEELSDDANDPYHYPVIRVLLVLNEQYMVMSATGAPITNRVVKMLSSHGNSYKTFGENLILLLNRESETSLQLLILKLLYLVFSSQSTAEYFYTNDLHVLLDVILRNLLDLPGPLEDSSDGKTSGMLRHTYLRVLHVLLAHSQLKRPGMGYKRDEVCKILRLLGSNYNPEANGHSEQYMNSMSSGMFAHFAPIDPTTLRLARRCAAVDWLGDAVGEKETVSPILTISPASRQKEVARRHLLGMSSPQGGESALSVIEMAEQKEKPGVLSPSRIRNANGLGVGMETGIAEAEAA
ncbi:hypothetical protein NA57DRAFT_37682 [Rhizodiscina lignyota]|uniref:SPIN90/Ldb17 leucine-rich domain-containing protein n=1 Tax=Rhizodiscina lignyota TaxID=1504668 RepID=A0A9P4MBR6_9PEZI|nr:hypothetical protein NA57DRAFT_37682 [Rhizodiscina lignyota]